MNLDILELIKTRSLTDDSHSSPTLFLLDWNPFRHDKCGEKKCAVQALIPSHHFHSGGAAVARGILGPGIREAVGILELTGEELVLVVLAVLFRAADMTAVRMVLAVAEDGLWVVRG